MKKHIALLLLSFIFLSACQKSSCLNGVKATLIDATGTDGCGMVLQLSNGKHLEPKNLADMNIDPKDGQKVWVSYHQAHNGVSVCMIGEIVVIDCISER